MSDPAAMAQRTKSEREAAERDLLARVEEVAADHSAPVRGEFLEQDTEDRFEPRLPPPTDESPEAEEEESSTAEDLNARWGGRPSVRNQIVDYPETVRMTEPQSMVVDPADPGQLEELNRIQRESNKDEDPTLAITDYERKFHDGKWSVFLTYSKIQYRQI